jgi:hypothetical protein
MRPDRLTIWPVESGGFGVDVERSGGESNRRATVVRGLLEEARIRHRLTQGVDGRTWRLRVGPVAGEDVLRVIEDFVW